ncbi:MAG: maltose alpha-D-glucosyltransferase [Verrucomicrobiota bacterium]|jgi:maltose alpha-D-glucosyltransferase/alpha-amylase
MPSHNHNREGLDPDPFWYKSGVIYEVHVRAFYDANGDGMGDFRGLTEKLDYIKDLGVTAIWLLPFYPSPLRDDGYDIADYCAVHPMYGTLNDFKVFLRQAHHRGLRVVTELVLNHTSDQHPWFLRARRARPGSRWRNFYVWSDDPHKYRDTYVIFKDVETSNWSWDPVARAYFWHRFFSHQPDLNFDNPAVREAMFKVVDFWLDLGVDGLRLDAVPYLYERDGTACENLPETHAFLKSLRAHVDKEYGDRMLLAEANQWPEDAAAYFGQGRGDECHMAFHFPLMPRLFMALRMEDSLPIVDILEQTPAIPETSQWALFLRNHDELTLSMVTDEERDFMFRMYAQMHQARLYLGIRRRLAPLLNNDRKSIELLNALLFSLPGTPVLYYGDEIGLGENIYLGDRNGVRTPMQWSPDKNAGFSRANPQSLYLPIILDPGYHYEAVNVEVQLANLHSLLWWMRRLLALRRRWRALGEGKCEFLHPDNRKVLAYLLRHEQETLLVVANLSRFVQPVELDLSVFKSRVPVELFGRAEFPAITERPFFLSLGPHTFFWFSLEDKPVPAAVVPASGLRTQLPQLTVEGEWGRIFDKKNKTRLEAVLPPYLKLQRWFAGRDRNIKSVTLREIIPVPFNGECHARLALLQVDYSAGDLDFYTLPLAFAAGAEAGRLREASPQLIIAEMEISGNEPGGILYEATGSQAFCRALLELILNRRRLKGAHGEVESTRTPVLRGIFGDAAPPESALLKTDQSHTSVLYGDKVILKLFRQFEWGVNPELVIGRFLTEKNFPQNKPLTGALEYIDTQNTRTTLAVVNTFIPEAKNAWEYTLDTLGRFYERMTTSSAQGGSAPAAPADPLKFLEGDIPAAMLENIGTYLESARLLGVRSAELHLTLASESEDKDFAPEPFTSYYQRSLFQSMRNLAVETLWQLRKQLKSLPPEVSPLAQRALELKPAILQRFRQLFDHRIAAQRIRIHGNLHLGEVLWTGKDFVFLDFEGSIATPITERGIKRSPLRDVAGLVRSFHHAAYAGLSQHGERGNVHPPPFETWAQHWSDGVSAVFLKAYFQRLGKTGLLPAGETELRAMLQAYLLNRMLREMNRELGARSDGLKVLLQDILRLIGEPQVS